MDTMKPITTGNQTDDAIVCYLPSMITMNGVWEGDNPLNYALPLFILQLTLVVVFTRIFVFILKPFRQPRVIAEILGGLCLGPSLLGRYPQFVNSVFPLRSVMVLETMANVGLLYFLFLVGLEMDISVIRRTGKKALAMALAGMVLPFSVGAAFSLIMNVEDGMTRSTYVLFLGVALSVTAFPVLARILAELKLINTEIGKLALSSSLINDMCAWVMLALAIAMSESEASSWASVWVLLSSAVFVVICFFVVRPAISWMISRTPEGESFSDSQICIVLTGVMISGFITDAIGTHSVFGAFVFGLIIPNGPLAVALIEKLEDFVSGLLLPLFFAISGLKTRMSAIQSVRWVGLLFVIPLALLGKVAGTLLVSFLFQIPAREGITLGLLMNTKGLVEIIVLNVGRDQKVLGDETFAIMVFITLIMTGLVSPIVRAIYHPTRLLIPYRKRTFQSSRLDTELRVLVCVHTPRNVPTIINLLDATYPSKKSPMCVYVLHLVELTGRASAMLIVHSARRSGRPTGNKTEAQSDHIINAFENFEQHTGHVSAQPLTAISPYSSMHEDICSLAEDKRVPFIIIPFHKQQTVDGAMEGTNPAFRIVNQNLLAHSPCSVGILVDRGLNGSNHLTMNKSSRQVAVLFFGGPDDREALSYACRMSEHPEISLTVMRFVPGDDAEEILTSEANRLLYMNVHRERMQDEEYINEFRTRTANDESICYLECVVNNGEQTVAAIRSMNSGHDLLIVGRGQDIVSPLTSGLTDWSECPELGVIGDLLASSDFATTASVLVVQQYVAPNVDENF
ncbi:hypothetical protein L6164_016994 [Bauhinia variegata]|uniref:Uncharacterized protein n=1 Tax=Bauhinia variegata TaxID=167791 RepID=A0ACB9N7A0_BAUVA|nr:hypothetical protein L6164_016994 [Bauhinia variegata]